MSKKISIIIIGFGSIGRRHYRNLIKLGYRNVFVFDIDYRRIRNYELGIRVVNLKVLEDFDVVFICTPNHLHFKYALLAAKAGCHLFIEKPLSPTLAGVSKLISVCQNKHLVNLVACNMRFNPALRFIKNYLDSNKLGRVYAIHHEFGYYLPFWRPHQDYRKNYAAQRKTGGGIILDDIHEFDLLFWLNNFKPVRESRFVYGKVSNLKIETEDVAVAAFKFKNGVIGSVRCDYLQQNESRNCKIIGEKGNLEWDFKNDQVWLKTKKGSKKLFSLKRKNDNQDYIDEIRYFLGRVKNKKETFNNFATATKILNYLVKK